MNYTQHKLVFYALTPPLSQRERENKENQFCLGISKNPLHNNLDITKLEISEILKKKIISKNIEEFVSKDYSIADIENLYSEEINIEN